MDEPEAISGEFQFLYSILYGMSRLLAMPASLFGA
jgi:hypothetical protein